MKIEEQLEKELRALRASNIFTSDWKQKEQELIRQLALLTISKNLLKSNS